MRNYNVSIVSMKITAKHLIPRSIIVNLFSVLILNSVYGRSLEAELKWKLECEFHEIGAVYDGLVSVRDGSGRWGLVDDNAGNWFIKPWFEEEVHFSEGLAGVLVDDKWGIEKWGFVDTSGRWVIEPQFERAFNFAEGFALAYKEHKWGYIDKTGKWVIEPQFFGAWNFEEGLALVQKDIWEYGFIDTT